MPSPRLTDVTVALERASAPLAIVDAASLWVEAANEAFAALVDVPQSGLAGMSLLSFMPASDLDALVGVLRGTAAGLVSLSQGRGTWGRGAHEVEVTWWIRPFAETRSGRLALCAVATNGAAPGVVPLPGKEAFLPGEASIMQVALDHHWRMEEVSLNADIVLGWQRSELLGTPIQACVHPDDIPAMLLVLGRASAEASGVAAPLRIRHGDGNFATMGFAANALCEHNPPRFAVTIWAFSTDGQGQTADIEAARLQHHLWAIAMEVQAAGLEQLGQQGGPAVVPPALREVSVRQLEIMRRLAAGERVPTIAAALKLSKSTVRNHLAAIYRRVGVHSQEELLVLLMGKRTKAEPPRAESPPGERHRGGKRVSPGSWRL
jgi:DNA-binding CsgD family transcriptional regulator